MTMSETGDGSSAKPYKNFEDALAAAEDGDTIVIQGKSILNEKLVGAAGVPCVIDKAITIQSEGESAALYVRTAGIVLAADVTLLQIELNFQNRYHNAIFANGHHLTANNVTHGSGSRTVHLFAGTIGAVAGLNFTATAGTNAAFTLQNSEFGNIYAGSVADDSSVRMNVDISNSKAIGNIYGSGAQEEKVTDDWFNKKEPDPPVADTMYAAGDATVTVDGSTALTVDGSGAKSMNVIVNGGKNRQMTFKGVTALTAQGGQVKVASINETAHVTLLNSAELDLSNAANGTDVKLATLTSSNGTGKLILGKSHLLTIASTMKGTFALETPDSFQNASSEAEYDHTYIKASIAEDATVNFTPHSTQSTMKLEKIPGDGTAWTTWKTTAAPTVPTTVSKFETTESSVSTDSDALQNGGITIPVTWESSDPASPFKSLSAIPFHYAVTYNEMTEESVDTEDGGMYESSVTFANGTSIWITAGDASEQDALPDRLDIGGNLSAGIYTITIYAPKADGSKIQQTLTLTVTDGTEAATATELTAPVADTQYTENDSVTLAAKVTSNGQPIGKGEVVFWINGTALGTQGQIKAVTVSADGTASTTVNASAANHFKINETNTVKASYRGVPSKYATSESTEITVSVNEAVVTADLAFTPSNIERKIRATSNTSNLEWNAATNTLTVLRDFTTHMPMLFIGFDEPVTLELNGHTMTFDISPALDVDSNIGLFTRDHTQLTIQDSKASGGMLKSAWPVLKLETGSEVTLKSGTVSGNPNGGGVVQSAKTGDRTKFTMDGGTVQAASNKGIAGDAVTGYCLYMTNCDISVTGGKLEATDEQSNLNRVGGIRLMNSAQTESAGAKATITGGTFTGFWDPCIAATGEHVEADISNTALESKFRTVMAQDHAKVTLTDCTVKQTMSENVWPNESDTYHGFEFAAIFVNGGEVIVEKGTRPTTIENANESAAAVWVQRYGTPTGSFTMTDGGITAKNCNAVYITGSSEVQLTGVTVNNEDAGWVAIYAQNSSTVTVNGGSVKAGNNTAVTVWNGATANIQNNAQLSNNTQNPVIRSNGSNVNANQIKVETGDNNAIVLENGSTGVLIDTNVANDSTSNNTYPSIWTADSNLTMTRGSVRSTYGTAFCLAGKSVGILTGTEIMNTQSGGGIWTKGSSETETANLTLENCKIDVQNNSYALWTQYGDVTVKSGTYRTSGGFALDGVDSYNYAITGGYFHGSADTLDATRADGDKLTLPTGKILSNAKITQQERTDNDLGTDYWWRLADPEPANVTVTFDVNTNGGQFADGTTAERTQTGEPDTALALPDVQERVGFNFNGWWTAANGGTQITAPAVFPAANATYFAQWTEKADVNVTFDSGDGIWNDNTTGEKKTPTKPGAAATIPGTVSRVGYTFDGWKADNNAYQDLAANAEKTDTILEGQAVRFTPKWRANTYIIHFDANGQQDATGAVNDMEYVYDTVRAALLRDIFTSPTRNMLGWSLDRNADTASYLPGAEIDGALKNAMVNSAEGKITLFAVWTDKDAVSMIFNAGEGAFADGSKEKIESVKPGQQNQLPTAPTREGYIFDSWTSGSADYPDLAKDATQTPVAIEGKNVTYTAKWVEASKVTQWTVTFSAEQNGTFTNAGDPMVRQSVEDGKTVTGTPAITANSNYRLDGWQIGGAGTVYTSAQVMAMAITKDLSFTASYTYTGGNSGGGGGGGGGSTTSYVIKASAGSGGTISPSGSVSVSDGRSKTFTITAQGGYRISDVLVDGESIGAVGEYTFEKVHKDHSIQVTFVKDVADPTNTGVSGWLNTGDHVAFMTGYANGLFGTEDHVTRAQVAQVFYRLLRDRDVTITKTFRDVPGSAWYAKAVNTLASLGMVSGVGEGRFEPDRAITRAEFTAIAAKFAKASLVGELSFVDVPAGAWYRESVLTAVNYGWIAGVGNGRFEPGRAITRAEAAAIVNRMLARSADQNFAGSIRQFADVSSSHWAYWQIVEASNGHDYRANGDGSERWTGLK